MAVTVTVAVAVTVAAAAGGGGGVVVVVVVVVVPSSSPSPNGMLLQLHVTTCYFCVLRPVPYWGGHGCWPRTRQGLRCGVSLMSAV